MRRQRKAFAVSKKPFKNKMAFYRHYTSNILDMIVRF